MRMAYRYGASDGRAFDGCEVGGAAQMSYVLPPVADCLASPHGSRSAGADLRAPPQLPREAQDSDRGEYGQRKDGRDRSRHRKHQERRGGGEEPIDYKLMVVTPPVGDLGGVEQCHPSGKGEGGQRRQWLLA